MIIRSLLVHFWEHKKKMSGLSVVIYFKHLCRIKSHCLSGSQIQFINHLSSVQPLDQANRPHSRPWALRSSSSLFCCCPSPWKSWAKDVSIQNLPAPPNTLTYYALGIWDLGFLAQVALNLFSGFFSYEFIPPRSEKEARCVHVWSHQAVDISEVELEGFGV